MPTIEMIDSVSGVRAPQHGTYRGVQRGTQFPNSNGANTQLQCEEGPAVEYPSVHCENVLLSLLIKS